MNWKLVFPCIDLYPPVSEEDIAAFQTRNQMVLPGDYVDFLLRFRGSLPMLQNERGEYRTLRVPVEWGDKPAKSLGPACSLEATFSLFEGKDVQSAFRSGYDLDDNILWNDHLYPPGVLPIGSNAGNSLFLLGVDEEHAGKVFFLSTFHVPNPMSFEHIGKVASTFTEFLRSGRPADAS